MLGAAADVKGLRTGVAAIVALLALVAVPFAWLDGAFNVRPTDGETVARIPVLRGDAVGNRMVSGWVDSRVSDAYYAPELFAHAAVVAGALAIAVGATLVILGRPHSLFLIGLMILTGLLAIASGIVGPELREWAISRIAEELEVDDYAPGLGTDWYLGRVAVGASWLAGALYVAAQRGASRVSIAAG